MKYLRKYETEADIDIDVTPNVVLVNDTKKVLYNYNPPLPLGVFIQHVDGKLYTTDEWTAKGFSNDEANGVAVSAEECAFVIAKENAHSNMWWCNDEQRFLVDGILATTDNNEAITDYRGKENSELMRTAISASAAYYCNKYLFPNGQSGYLPSFGEWKKANEHKASVELAMSLIGGVNLSGNYWSSTQYDALKAWYIQWYFGTAEKTSKSSYCTIRAFCPIL